MSTRSQIGFYRTEPKTPDQLSKPEALIYRHSDGYPGTTDGKAYGVLSEIYPFLRWWNKGRGLSDCEYVSARLLQWLTTMHDKDLAEYEHNFQNGNKEAGFTGQLGYGISSGFHGDIEFYYAIYPNAILVFDTAEHCLAPKAEYAPEKPENWKLLYTIPLNGEVKP